MGSEIQTIFQNYFFHNNHIYCNQQQEKAVRSILSCRTSHAGGVKIICRECGHEHYIYCSCGNRHCPICNGIKQLKWSASKIEDTVDTIYFHAVFTIPYELNKVVYTNQKECYNLLFKAVAETLTTLGADKKWLGCKIGFMSTLHTWGAKLNYHPHIHVLIMGCGLNDCMEVIESKDTFLFPVKVMSTLFKNKFLAGLKELNLENVDYDNLYSRDWVVYLKESLTGNAHLIQYLSRYVCRIAITDARIVSFDNEKVTFSYKDYKDNCKIKQTTISTEDFIKRFLRHVLPKGFVKTRSYGMLANKHKEKCLKIIRNFLKSPKRTSIIKGKSTKDILRIVFKKDFNHCTSCGSKNIFPVKLTSRPLFSG